MENEVSQRGWERIILNMLKFELILVTLNNLKYSKPSIIRHSIIRHLWSTATNLRGHFAIPPVSKLPD